jgi:hypothetical protein
VTSLRRDDLLLNAPSLDPATVARVDDGLSRFREALGPDAEAYRHHVCRVLAFVSRLLPVQPFPEALPESLLQAAVFHDLGIWTDRTFDYLAPSRRLAAASLAACGASDIAPEVEAVIEHHHKLTRYRGPFEASVEVFRRADLVDVSLGLVSFGLERPFVAAVRREFPNAGFHRRLAELTGRQLLRTPLRPLPMLRW